MASLKHSETFQKICAHILPKFFRIQSLKEENFQLKIQVEEGYDDVGIKQSMLVDATSRLVESENQLQAITLEHAAYKERAKKVLLVRTMNN